MTTLVVMAIIHEKNLNDIFSEYRQPILIKFNILPLFGGCTKNSKMVMIRNSRWPSCPYMVKPFN